MSKQTELVGLARTTKLDEVNDAYDAGALSNRNMVINGAMQVAQRGTSFTASTQVLDRWRLYNSGGTYTLSQQTFAGGTSPETGLINYVRIVRANPSGIFYFASRIEDVRRTDGATLTFSFYAKASSAVTVPCRISQEFGSGGSSSYNPTPQNNNLTTSWQRFTMVFNMPSLSGKTVGTASRFEPVFDIPATTATIEITGVQLELGDTSTPFEHRSYGDELQKCQRYLYAINAKGHPSSTSAAYARFITFAQGPNAVAWFPQYPVQMRALPSLIATNVSSSTFQMFNYDAQASVSLTGMSQTEGTQTTGQVVFTTASGISAGDIVSVRWNNSPNASFQFDAEL